MILNKLVLFSSKTYIGVELSSVIPDVKFFSAANNFLL